VRRNGTEDPIKLLEVSYDWQETSGGLRSRYKLPPGVASTIEAVASSMGLYDEPAGHNKAPS
jgi:hypothetical protein